MSTPYYINVTIHVLAAMLWLGGMFFLGAVGAPVLRTIEPRRCGSASSSSSACGRAPSAGGPSPSSS
jgi:putative copper export protein